MTKRNMTIDELVESHDEHTRRKVLERLEKTLDMLEGARADVVAMIDAVSERRYIEQTLMRGAPKASQVLNEAAVELTSAVIEHNTVDAFAKAARGAPDELGADVRAAFVAAETGLNAGKKDEMLQDVYRRLEKYVEEERPEAWEEHDPAPRDRVDHNSDVRKVIDDRKTDIGTDEEGGKFVSGGVLHFNSPLGDNDRSICAQCGTREPQEYIGAHSHELDRCPDCYDAFQQDRLEPGMLVRINNLPWSGEPDREAQMVGLLGQIVKGPYTTEAGTYFEVELDAPMSVIADASHWSVDEVRGHEKRFEFEPRQLDDRW